MRPQVTYTANLAGFPVLALAIAVLLGAFGGTEFQRGVAGVLTMGLAETLNVQVTGSHGWVKYLALVLMPVGLLVLVGGVALAIAGL